MVLAVRQRHICMVHRPMALAQPMALALAQPTVQALPIPPLGAQIDQVLVIPINRDVPTWSYML